MDVSAIVTPRMANATALSIALPAVSPWLLRLFLLYARRYMQRSFHAVRLLRAGQPPQLPDRPLVVYCNHPSWWDPLLCLFLAQHYFPARTHYGPMDAAALARYRFLTRLGFFGLATGTRQGAVTLLRVGQALAQRPQTALWITPQGQFTDPRQRPTRFQPGLGHLGRCLSSAAFVPLALEYPFWHERFPEALACFGDAVLIDQFPPRRATDWTALLARQLEATQDRLTEAARQQAGEPFETLLRGRVGVGGVYDLWRRLRAWQHGDAFQPGHGRDD
ncbi:MAG: acyltransferase [Candidatus Tectomicrobia bacterium]|uniref:Acyltransferase n=1 Tax=Tectimicrobiota bacterium TaxID=2528274 RepID=A0A938B556_UNCTE|nr:acyltransferase [Candidatus Tectomicrobia bacterium]